MGMVITMRDLMRSLLNGMTEDLRYLTSGGALICAQMKKAMRLSGTFSTIPNY